MEGLLSTEPNPYIFFLNLFNFFFYLSILMNIILKLQISSCNYRASKPFAEKTLATPRLGKKNWTG